MTPARESLIPSGSLLVDPAKVRARAELFVELSVGPAGSLAQDVIMLLDEVERLRDSLGKIASQQRKTLGILRSHGIVFNGPLGNDPSNWQHVAFSIYTDLCEVDTWARQALGDHE